MDKLNDAQRAALDDLSGDEIDTVVRVAGKLSGGGEVTGQAMAASDDLGIFYY